MVKQGERWLMNQRKNPPSDCSLNEGHVGSINWEEGNKFRNDLQASISSRGCVVHRYKKSGRSVPENLKKRKEGDIKGWSKNSRIRMRRFLMDYREREGNQNFAVTLTVPGGVMPPKEYKTLFDGFCRKLSRKPVLMVWRAEVQKRGALHWHCICSLPEGRRSNDIYELWWQCVHDLGAFEDKEKGISGTSRMALNGAHGHSCDVKAEKDNDCWWRYLCDHASKSKQEQIGENIGRHWGVVGRKYAVQAVSDEVIRLTDEQVIKLDRFLRRLRTPRVKDERDPFGYRLGWAPKMSRFGRSDYFGHQSAVSRFLKSLS